ncbi:MAG: TraB domain-containing protein, partial [Spirochaetota bacterium]
MSSNILNFDIYGKQIFLIGTAHVSSESVDEVRLAIRDNKPDCVCVETDEGRFKTMTEKNNWEKLDIVSKLMASLLSSVLSKEVLSTEEIKNLKDKSVLDGMMCGLASFLPSMKEVLNDQRDRFLTTKIFQSRHRLGVLAGWVIPAALLAMIVIGFLKSGATASFGLLAKWLIIHGIGSAIGTLLALGSPITIFAS